MPASHPGEAAGRVHDKDDSGEEGREEKTGKRSRYKNNRCRLRRWLQHPHLSVGPEDIVASLRRHRTLDGRHPQVEILLREVDIGLECVGLGV